VLLSEALPQCYVTLPVVVVFAAVNVNIVVVLVVFVLIQFFKF